MSCNITSGIAGECNTNIGGVKNVYLSNNGTVWYTYEMDKGTASLVETYNVNQAGSILGFTQTLTMQLNKMSADKQDQIAKIAEANSMQVRVETNEGTVFQFGVERGAYLASGTSTSGTAYTDTNQSELVIQADSKSPMTVSGVPAPVPPGTTIVDYSVVSGTGMEGGNSFPFYTKTTDLLETMSARPIIPPNSNLDTQTGFNINTSVGVTPPVGGGSNYLNNTYAGLQTLWNMTITLESLLDWPTNNPSVAWDQYEIGFRSTANEYYILPASYYTGWITTAPTQGQQWTTTMTNVPINYNATTDGFTVDNYARIMVLKNGSISNDLQFNIEAVSGQITIQTA